MELFKFEKTSLGKYCYAVAFNHDTRSAKYFNYFMEVLGSLRDKKYDARSKMWLVDEEGMNKFYQLQKKLYPTKKKKPAINVSIKKKKVINWEDIGTTMKLPPYSYQKQVIQFIVTPHGQDNSHDTLITAPCGSGKTAIAIGAYLECLRRGVIEGPGMIVVKASLKFQWFKEVEKFSDLKPRIVKTYSECVGSIAGMIKRREQKIQKVSIEESKQLKQEIKDLKDSREKIFYDQFSDADLYILNYETLNDEKVREAMLKIAPQFIASDETQYIKGASNKRSRSLHKFNSAKVKIGATATPVQRDPRDIYGLFKFIHPELFKNSKSFNALYVRYGYGYQVIGAKNEKKLNEKISPYTFILTKEEVAKQLPKLMVSQRYCELGEKQREVNDAFMEELEELNEKEKALTKGMSEAEVKSNEEIMKLEAAISARQTFLQELTLSEELFKDSESPLAKKFITGDSSMKLQVLKDIVTEIVESGEKVVIFSRFARMQPIITSELLSVSELKGIKIAYIRGDLSAEQRYEEVYTKFRDNDDYKVLVCSDAGAEGVNLSLCKYMIEMEPAVSYAIQTQRHGRLERADSVHDTVHVVQLIAENSWDEIMLKSIEKKEKYDRSIIKGKDVID